MKSLLVIGGSGFFGKTILDAYRRGKLRKWQITKIYVFARNADFLKISNPELLGNGVVLINGDVANCASLPAADYVIHAAASSDASKYIEAPEIEKRNILAGTINFCNLMLSADKATKILYVSSGAVYGDSSPEAKPFCEEDKFVPIVDIGENKRHYSAAKRDSESHIFSLGEYGARVSIARCFAFIGKYLPRDQHFAIGNFIQNGLDKQSIKVKALKKVYRSYMYADDLVEWLMSIVENAKDSCPVFNVGSDEVFELSDVAKMISDKFGVTAEVENQRSAEVDYYIPDIEKAKFELRLSVTTCLNEALDFIITDMNYNICN